MADDAIVKELEEAEEAFNRAVVSNDVTAISYCISEDWVLVTPETGPIPRDRFLQVVEQGILSHDGMTKDISRVRVYGEVAVVTGLGHSTGMFQGAPIDAEEWVTDVYVKSKSRWICTLTQLTPVAAPGK